MASSPWPVPANVAIASIFIDVTFVTLRFWARWIQKSRWMWSDIIIPISLGLNLTMAALVIRVFATLDVINHSTVATSKYTAFWIPIVYGLASAVPKLAVLDTYLNIFTQKWARWTLIVCGIVIIANGIVYIPTTITSCRPIEAIWNHRLKGAKCGNIKAHYSLASLPNIVTDVAMLLVPIPIVTQLQMTKTVKAGVMATFLSGSIGLIASIIRFIMFLRWTPATNHNVEISIASTAEASFYLIAACLLSLRPLITRLLSRAPSFTGFLSKYTATGTTHHGSRLATKDKKNSRRLTSMDRISRNSSTGELVTDDIEAVSGKYELQTVTIGLSQDGQDGNSNHSGNSIPQKPHAASIAHLA